VEVVDGPVEVWACESVVSQGTALMALAVVLRHREVHEEQDVFQHRAS